MAKRLRLFKGVFVLFLSAAPVLVGGQTVRLVALSQHNSLLANFAWFEVLYPSLLLAMLLGFVSWFAVFVPTGTSVRSWPMWPRLTVMAFLILLTVVTLWLVVVLAYLSVVMAYRQDLLTSSFALPSRVFTVGWIWTGSVLLALLYLADYVYRSHSRGEHLESGNTQVA